MIVNLEIFPKFRDENSKKIFLSCHHLANTRLCLNQQLIPSCFVLNLLTQLHLECLPEDTSSIAQLLASSLLFCLSKLQLGPRNTTRCWKPNTMGMTFLSFFQSKLTNLLRTSRKFETLKGASYGVILSKEMHCLTITNYTIF